jgi:hypothetical protein
MTLRDAQPKEKLFSDGYIIGNLTHGTMKFYEHARELDNFDTLAKNLR